MSYNFNAEKITAELIGWVRNYFEKTASPDTKGQFRCRCGLRSGSW